MFLMFDKITLTPPFDIEKFTLSAPEPTFNFVLNGTQFSTLGILFMYEY
jgi:hypothetical protein